MLLRFAILLIALGDNPVPQTTPSGVPQAGRFVLHAGHHGYSLRNSWDFTVDETGRAFLRFWTPSDGRESLPVFLSPQTVRDLRAAIAAADLLGMRDSYGILPVDAPFRNLVLTENDRTTSVSIHTLAAGEFPSDQHRDIKRLIRLWAHIRGLLPVGSAAAADARSEDRAFLRALASQERAVK